MIQISLDNSGTSFNTHILCICIFFPNPSSNPYNLCYAQTFISDHECVTKIMLSFIEKVLFYLWEMYTLDITKEMSQVPKCKSLLTLDTPYRVQNILTKGKHNGQCKQMQLEVKRGTLRHIKWSWHLCLGFWLALFGYSCMSSSVIYIHFDIQCQDRYLRVVFSFSL